MNWPAQQHQKNINELWEERIFSLVKKTTLQHLDNFSGGRAVIFFNFYNQGTPYTEGLEQGRNQEQEGQVGLCHQHLKQPGYF